MKTIYCLKKYLLQVLAIWNWILGVANSSNAFPSWKMFCPVEVNTYLIKNTFIAGYNLFIASSTSRADRYLTFDQT